MHGHRVAAGDAEGVWINADPLPGAVVCNIGEMWETWTAGLYKSTLHRVVHRSPTYRVSYVLILSVLLTAADIVILICQRTFLL
jgi:isopenicillin N synthase-like dioxygenase